MKATRNCILLLAGLVFAPIAQESSGFEEAAIGQETEAANDVAPGPSKFSLGDIIVGGTYHMSLTTGDILEGVIESKDDSSIVVETKGKPYTFRASLIKECVLVAPPGGLARESGDEKVKGVAEATILSFEDVLKKGKNAGIIDIRIINGSTFRGAVVLVNEEMIKLNIKGSEIPIAREVIEQISTVPTESDSKESAEGKKEIEGPYDTVYFANPETDEYGKPLAPVAIIGKITRDDATGMTIVTPKGLSRTLKRDRIMRVNKHTVSSYELKIKDYAKPLFCPSEMILVDMPPGKPDRPFFKVCVDRFEYPNRKDAIPQGNASYSEAQQACESKGKRLCSAEEWQWACGGMEGYAYPYGWQYDKKNCNSKGVEQLEASGLRHRCVGKFGIYDMVGNIFEWVTGKDGKPMLMGGPFSKCQTVSPGMNGDAKPQTGFRCCKNN